MQKFGFISQVPPNFGWVWSLLETASISFTVFIVLCFVPRAFVVIE